MFYNTHTHSKRNFHVKHNVRASALSYHHPPHIYEREVDTGAKAHAADISKENVHDNTSVFLVMRANGKMCECNLYFQRKCDGTCGAVYARIWCQWIGANASIFLWLNGGWFFFYCTFNNNNRMLPFGFGVCWTICTSYSWVIYYYISTLDIRRIQASRCGAVY